MKSDFGAQAGGSEDGVEHYDKELPEPVGEDVSRFLRKVMPEVEAVMEANASSTAFDGYLMNLQNEGQREDAELWRTLTVDLEKHKVSCLQIVISFSFCE